MAKQQKPVVPSDIRKAIEPDQSLFKFSLISLLGSLAAFAVAAFLLYNTVINGSNKQLRVTLFESHAKSYSDYFNLKLGQLQSQLTHVAANDQLSAALQENDAARLTELEKAALANIPHLFRLQLLTQGSARLNQEQLQLSFPEIDMVNRAEKSERVPAEAHSSKGQQLIRMVQSVKASNADTINGVILASFTLDALKIQLNNFDTEYGSMQLEQVFRGSDPQLLIQTGSEFNAEQPILETQLKSPHLRVRFQPSNQLAQENTLSAWRFWLPLAFALIAVIISILVAYLQLRKHVRSDAITLVNYCRELISGAAGKEPAFALSLFHSMAKTLGYTDRESTLITNGTTTAKEEEPREEQPHQAATTGSMEVSNLIEAELQDEDILDLDLPEIEEFEQNESVSKQKSDDTSIAGDTGELPKANISSEIFRAYDIRGIIDDTLNTEVAYRIGQAVGSEAAAQGEKSIVVGADGRLSSPELCAALAQGLRDTGRDVINIGTVPTPLVYYATHNTDAKSGIVVTGSHNPSNYNGFKIVIAGQTLANEQIQSLRTRIEKKDFCTGGGSLEDIEIVNHYIERIVSDIAMAKPLKVVIDCGNGVASVVAPKLIESLGCEVVPLYCEIDGRFPNHHPDPGKPENLQDLIAAVAEHQADLGLAFDGDGDRVGVVTNKGNIVWPDRLMMLFAKDVASRNPGADIIYDVKCTRRLAGLISNYGGRPIMWKTGHSLIKAKMRETGALLAGEMSGHIFFKERWFGFDDGLYSAARLLEILSLTNSDAETLFSSFPDDVSTPEINIEVTEQNKFNIVAKLQDNIKFDDAEITTIDGVRADFENGWGLVRASNTTPVLVLRFGAEDEAALETIKDRFKQVLLEVEPTLSMPF